ncbi:NAD-P-binding protein [Calocera viscosa TUFC12733]|uniref:NAD-P-binding protein n=1 Tax=Calocera viscosa (strain TUFC12733) TaxID=1330018 RepID=A0A167S142_CALVF|nr:NAD-P-binding protein [Calocera viscosa TUFC12733]
MRRRGVSARIKRQRRASSLNMSKKYSLDNATLNQALPLEPLSKRTEMSATASPAVVFVTGGNGFLGTTTVLELIKQGYKVKGTIRSQAKADAFNKKYPTQSSSIDWVVVPELTNEIDMTTATADVDYVIHMASPFRFNFKDSVKEVLEPARDVTLVTLKAAAKHPRIKRVLITSSFVAVWDLMKDGGLWPGKTFTADDWNPATWEQGATVPNPFFVYSVSKAIAEKAAFEFVEKEKPGFSITTLCPPIMYGPPIQPEVTTSNLNTSMSIIWSVLSGQSKEYPTTGLPVFVDVRDLAWLQVTALKNEKAANQRYLTISDHWYFEELAQIVKEEFPEQASRLPPVVRTEGPVHFGFDVSKTVDDFDIQWIPLRKSIVDTMKALYEMEKEEKAGKL